MKLDETMLLILFLVGLANLILGVYNFTELVHVEDAVIKHRQVLRVMLKGKK